VVYVHILRKKEHHIVQDVATTKVIHFGFECKVYACATEHKVEHCGLCKDFPCSLFIGQYDPEHGRKNSIFRAGLLAYRKKAGTEKYIEMVQKTGSH